MFVALLTPLWQQTILQKVLTQKDFTAALTLLRILRGNLPPKPRRAAPSPLHTNDDGVFSHLVRRHKPRPGALAQQPRDELLSVMGGLYPSLIMIMNFFVTGFNNQMTFDIFKLYLETFQLSTSSLTGALCFALTHPAMPLPVISQLLADGADPTLSLPPPPDVSETSPHWDAEHEWLDVLIPDLAHTEHDFARSPRECMSAETPDAVRALIAHM